MTQRISWIGLLLLTPTLAQAQGGFVAPEGSPSGGSGTVIQTTGGPPK